MNDLLYIASAIAPATFNDITMGNERFFLCAGRRDHERQCDDHADRLRLRGRIGLRPGERAGHAQRHAAGTGS